MRKLILSVAATFMVAYVAIAQGTTYCSSKGLNSNYEFISRIRIRQIDNRTQSDNGYGDYTALSTSLVIGTYDTIRITPRWSGTFYNEGYSAWIDFNRDGDFTDAGEQVLSISPTMDTLIRASFHIPDAVLPGATRMRVAMKWNAIPTSCEAFQYGEVEDYTINIACASRGLNANLEYINRIRIKNLDVVSGYNFGYADFTARSATLFKGAHDTITIYPKRTGGIRAEGYSVWIDYNRDGDFADTLEQVMQRPATTDTLIRTTFSVPASALTGSTIMRISMKYSGIPASCETFPNGEVEDYTIKIVDGNEKVYCESRGLNVGWEYIKSVDIGYLHNVSGANGGYANFTSLVTNIAKDSLMGIKITPGLIGGVYSEGYSVWMDYNRDGDFTDSAEQVVVIPASITSPDYVGFFIPASVPLGLVRMRVSMKYNGVPTSCETFQYGEVEDYTLNIINKHTVYCKSKGTSVAKGYINRVQVGVSPNEGSMDNVSGSNNGYGNFSWNTSLRPVLTRDSASSITITPLVVGSQNTGYSVWIDYNGDGDFMDQGEQIVGVSGVINTPAVVHFFVPASAPFGYARMRVAVKFGGVAASCDSIPYGEVEDYTVYIKSRVGIVQGALANQRLMAADEANNYEETEENHLYPNPAKNNLNIRIAESTKIKSVKVVSGAGSVLHHIKQSSRSVDVSALQPGIYLLIVETDKGLIRNKFVKN